MSQALHLSYCLTKISNQWTPSNHHEADKFVQPTAHVGYYAGKPIVRVVSCLNNKTVKIRTESRARKWLLWKTQTLIFFFLWEWILSNEHLRASDLFVRFEERLICLIFAVLFLCTHFVTRGVSVVNFTGLTLLKNINSTWNFCWAQQSVNTTCCCCYICNYS